MSIETSKQNTPLEGVQPFVPKTAGDPNGTAFVDDLKTTSSKQPQCNGTTHSCCNTRTKTEGGKARCCYCRPHGGCDFDSATSKQDEAELEDSINEEVSLAVHKFHAASGAVVINQFTRDATAAIMQLILQDRQATRKAVVGEIVEDCINEINASWRAVLDAVERGE